MTAISLNHSPAQSIDIAGIPLERLPPLESGRTLPRPFADVLSKSGTPADQTPAQGKAKPDGADGDKVTKATNAGEADPGIAAKPHATGTAATGKTLPSARPEIAAEDAPEGQVEDQLEADAADPAGEAELAPAVPVEGVATAAIATGNAVDTAVAASGGIAATQAGVAADIAQPKGAARTGALGASPTQPITVSIAQGSPTHSGQDPANAQQGQANGGQAEHAAQSTPRTLADQARQFAGTQTVAAQSNPAQAAAPQAAAPQNTAAHTTMIQDAAQAGISLQVRAADKPFADKKSSAPASALSTTSGAVVAAPLSGQPVLAPTALGAPQAGLPPQFTELAALVDRIEAARASTGSASATISLAHKELGNLALTFETSGRNLAVEVAAKDNETQRSLAAAIAADRPHVRTTETQAQTLQNQLASSANGSSGDARGSATAGDAQSERRGDPRNASQQGTSGEDPKGPKPKSDGGIYA